MLQTLVEESLSLKHLPKLEKQWTHFALEKKSRQLRQRLSFSRPLKVGPLLTGLVPSWESPRFSQAPGRDSSSNRPSFHHDPPEVEGAKAHLRSKSYGVRQELGGSWWLHAIQNDIKMTLSIWIFHDFSDEWMCLLGHTFDILRPPFLGMMTVTGKV